MPWKSSKPEKVTRKIVLNLILFYNYICSSLQFILLFFSECSRSMYNVLVIFLQYFVVSIAHADPNSDKGECIFMYFVDPNGLAVENKYVQTNKY